MAKADTAFQGAPVGRRPADKQESPFENVLDCDRDSDNRCGFSATPAAQQGGWKNTAEVISDTMEIER
jgi:hypothetical protein